jgi:hypothetical protein
MGSGAVEVGWLTEFARSAESVCTAESFCAYTTEKQINNVMNITIPRIPITDCKDVGFNATFRWIRGWFRLGKGKGNSGY